ncbi:MAG TPA: ester cyclase [Steroidobacteraceae bacterium]|jgi:predicted ester cyclase|nr:ester cyclase [Steroidobacteraceae bacterium]
MQIDRRRVLTLAVLTVPASLLQAQPLAEAERDQIEHTDLAAQNAGIIRRQNLVQNGGDAAGAAQFFAEDTRNHGVPVGRKGVLRVLTDIINTFPDWHTQIEDLAAIGDDVITRVISTGTHKGVGKIPVNGGLLVGVPPTGNTFKVQSIHWHTLKNGLIVEHRASRDDIGMMQQLGLLPAVKRYDLPQK